MVNEKLLYILKKQKEAYEKGPSGNWRQRWIPGVCKHLDVRCIHGDEIIARRWRRVVCLICGRALKRPLPDICFFTGEPH